MAFQKRKEKATAHEKFLNSLQFTCDHQLENLNEETQRQAETLTQTKLRMVSMYFIQFINVMRCKIRVYWIRKKCALFVVAIAIEFGGAFTEARSNAFQALAILTDL